MDDLYKDLPPTQFELEQQRHLVVTAQNEERERRRRRRANRTKGHPVPKVGEMLYVSIDRTLPRRTRAGIRFERGQRLDVTVVDASDDEIEARQRAGQRVINLDGAEKLYEDTSLNVFSTPAVELEAAELRQKNEALEEEVTLMRAELARVKEVRAARAAAESKAGEPARLNAARAAQGGPPAKASQPASGDSFTEDPKK